MSKSRKQSNLIQPGDLVEIVRPERFVRCGYDWNPSVAIDYLIEHHEREIVEFLRSLDMENTRYMELGREWNPDNPREPFRIPEKDRLKTDSRAIRRFLQGLGYLFCNSRGLGDKKRKIFTVPIDKEILNQSPFRVCGFRYVVTGEYYPPGGGYSYEGEYDFEPGGLRDQKHHRIVELYVVNSGTNPPHIQWEGFWIGADNLRVVEKAENPQSYLRAR